MFRLYFVVFSVLFSFQSQAIDIECTVRGLAKNGQSFEQKLTFDRNKEIYVLPDGWVSEYPEWDVSLYLEQHGTANLPYDDSDEGNQNFLNVMDGTLIFNVFVDVGNDIVNLVIYRLKKDLSFFAGPELVGFTGGGIEAEKTVVETPLQHTGQSKNLASMTCTFKNQQVMIP